jgi:hypothetical protein
VYVGVPVQVVWRFPSRRTAEASVLCSAIARPS